MDTSRHLYYHIPFCHRICPYCGFYKHRPGRASYARFADALTAELRFLTGTHSIEPETLYFGGGTPSMLPAAVWERVARGMRDLIPLHHVREWTLEANPRTCDPGKVRAWVASGVTRVSLGVQAFDDVTLRTLGRDHVTRDVAAAVEALREGGIPHIGIDLMFSIPGQTLADWRHSLEQALRLRPHHLSAYNLTYEEDTPFLSRFESGEWSVDSDRDASFFLLAHELLGAAGYEHYEVSNYARPGYRSRHNQAYWRGRSYLGLGPSAVSTVGRERFRNVPDTVAYMEQVEAVGHAREEGETLTEEQLALERFALGLRTRDGVAADRVMPEHRELLSREGLAREEEGRLRLTPEGMMVADEITGYVID